MGFLRFCKVSLIMTKGGVPFLEMTLKETHIIKQNHTPKSYHKKLIWIIGALTHGKRYYKISQFSFRILYIVHVLTNFIISQTMVTKENCPKGYTYKKQPLSSPQFRKHYFSKFVLHDLVGLHKRSFYIQRIFHYSGCMVCTHIVHVYNR